MVYRGWVPHDEGTLAQPATRVLQHGELPHRDFDDMYTGGQALYHAGVFEILGVRLRSLRTALFGAFLLTLPLLWYVATRFAGPVAAGGAVLLAGAWSIPVYPAAMPSWYNLFLAVAAVAAAFRYLETRHRRWLAGAGACVGLSITIKVAGLYMLAALLLFAVHREQEMSRRAASGGEPTSTPSGRAHSIFVTGSLALFVAALVWLVRELATPATFFHFVLPPAVLAGWLAWREWREAPALAGRTRRLASLLFPVVAGALLPLVAFLAPYVLSGSTGRLLHGVFVLPARRFEFATRLPPPLVTALPLAGIVGVTAWAAGRRKAEGVVAGVLGVGLLAVLVLAEQAPAYRGAWWLIRPAIPILVLGAIAGLATGTLAWSEASGGAGAPASPPAGHRDRFFLLLAATALVSLVQFPTSAPVYFFYAAPLAVLLGLALVAGLPRPPWRSAGVLAGFHVLFAVFWIHTGWIYQMGDYYAAHPPTEPLELERGGIGVVAEEKAEMEGLVSLLDRVVPEATIWVTPDAPEVYFLARRPNPTRTLFDFFDRGPERQDRILSMLEERQVGAVVYNTGPAQFSGLPSRELQGAIAERYPRGARMGRFVVMWKGDPPGEEPPRGDAGDPASRSETDNERQGVP